MEYLYVVRASWQQILEDHTTLKEAKLQNMERELESYELRRQVNEDKEPNKKCYSKIYRTIK